MGNTQRKPGRFHPYVPSSTKLHTSLTGNPLHRLGNKSETGKLVRKVGVKPQTSTRSRPKGLRSINDNYCVSNVVGLKDSVIVSDKMEGLNPPPVTDQKNSKLTLNVDSHVANAHIVTGLPQRKGVNPNICQLYTEIKYVKDVSCVGQLPSVKLVTNAQHAVLDPPVGARLNQCWQKWETLGSSPKVVNILREGYTLPFRFRPHLTRSPTVISNYHNPTKQSFLIEALYQLLNKNAVEPVDNPNSLGFYNRLFLVPKPNNRWRPILDLSTLNTFLNTGSFKMETPETIRTSLQVGEWVTSIDFKDAYFHIPIHSQSRKYMRFHLQGRSYQFKALPFGLSTAPMEFTVVAKEVKLMALQKGIRIHQYLDDWLVRASTLHTCLQHTQTLVTLCQELGWLVNKEKSELAPKQVFNFVGYQFDLKEGKVRPTEERWQALTDKIRSMMSDLVCPVRKFMSLIGLLKATEKQVHLGRLHMRPIQWHLKNNWRVPESLEKVIPVPKPLHPHLRWWLEESNVLLGQPLHPLKHALQIFTDASNEGWGAHLDDHTARGTWSLPESKLHMNHLELKAVFLALKEFRTLVCNKTVLIATDNTTVVAYINKEGEDEVGVTVCPTVENPVLVHQTAGNPQGTSHPRPAERDSRQAIQTWPDHSNRVVTSSSSIPSCMRKVAPATSGPVCHQVQQQTAPVCVTGARPPGLGSGCTQSLLGGPGPIRLPTGSHLGQSGGEAPGLPLQQNNLDCPRVAQHALGLGPGSNVKPDPTVSAQPTQPSVSAIQPGPSQEPVKSEPTCLAPRASAIKEQGFSEAVAARIEAPQRRSTRSVYEAKWTIFTKWCLSNQVDFRAPPLKAIADFLLHLFQDKKLQPGTIDGYRSAIADKLGNSTINVSKDENLTRLLDSFHRDRPKGRRGIPSWNLSLVLHQLTKAPFEPLKESSLKHLTFKTVFLLALGSGKRRSEIHAWLHKNIRHQSDWSKVSLYPSPSFLSKNQLAKEGPDSVAPVVIPALAPSLDRSLKGDRSLCPVRALRYYLDRTADLRQNKELVFVSFKKGFDKDISPATISSWIKQTVVLCYELSDQEALTLHQVKAHDVRAFAASKAFQSGISLDQILSACHWKSHNTFTQFYLKDVAWADSELFHLGPVVAAQQVHHQASEGMLYICKYVHIVNMLDMYIM